MLRLRQCILIRVLWWYSFGSQFTFLFRRSGIFDRFIGTDIFFRHLTFAIIDIVLFDAGVHDTNRKKKEKEHQNW